jgi:hypothetical protein
MHFVAVLLLHCVGSLSACVGWFFYGVGCFRSRSFSRLLFVPAGGFSSRLVLLVPLVLFPVPLPSVFWWWCSSCCFGNFFAGLCPVVVACCGGVVLCSFPLSFFLPKGGGWGSGGLAILLSNPKVSSGKLHRLVGRV